VRLVLDTDVVVAAMRSPAGASAELLRRARRGQVRLAASVSLFMEYEAVCLREEHLSAAGLTPAEGVVLLDALASLVQPVSVHFLWRPQLRDPADELVLEAAVNARADALLTFNLRHFKAATARFGLPVMRPADALVRLEKEPRA